MIKKTFITLSLYIHMPWCLHKCPYCDFNSHTLKESLPEKSYIDRLIIDFKSQLNYINGRTINSIFIGGGTPSLIEAQSYERLFKAINHLCSVEPTAEITLEANPGSVEQNRFEGYREAGINRLSIGIQSFDNQQLKKLERIHDANEAIESVNAARQAGFENYNLDLMFGLVNQDIESALKDLKTAIHLNPTHLSWYQLTIEPHTFFYHQPPNLPSEDTICTMQETGVALLHQYGFKQYEISAFSKDHYQCEHNRNYWKFGDYIGIGAGAHGKITLPNKQIIRRWNLKNPKDYMNPKKVHIHNEYSINKKEQSMEFMMNVLRLYEAIPLKWLESRTQLRVNDINNVLFEAQKKNLLKGIANSSTLQKKDINT